MLTNDKIAHTLLSNIKPFWWRWPQHLPPLLSHADIHRGARCSAVLAHCMYMQARWCTFVWRFFRLLTIGIFHCVSENGFLKDVFIEKPTHMFTHRYLFADFTAWTGQGGSSRRETRRTTVRLGGIGTAHEAGTAHASCTEDTAGRTRTPASAILWTSCENEVTSCKVCPQHMN